MNREQMIEAANDLILHRAADRMLNQGISREQVNEYLRKTPLEQIKADNLKAENVQSHAGYSLMGSIIEQLRRQDDDMAAVHAGRQMQLGLESRDTVELSGTQNEREAGKQKSEVTVEFLKTLPAGSRIRSVTLPSDKL
ncbi:hypothetical protein ABA45_02370 [Marinobacter psychrophilus]|uniref:Uncharacterized protein n=1 Tax=Marinobacter psychrophilus TaxID=330734 RepID=A0A0H4I8M5_9GAMM|nr:hypothetical protein [Marinobacter psychrophilus]AKO51402.1 hypothetical protein ABA45_02370 [Marinobacter psychrophilus]